ncbi:hypothetical protein ADIS_0618 [Lunatimonas lonarensis]|uniref:Uncharacterized protein n=1 Tax=Lunatimonas lonarensis TaxID=1232681 RepID=R7ZX37_9BACT|nr:hypothetical protein ADIS_0618 [Lunatimonas lonarensis]
MGEDFSGAAAPGYGGGSPSGWGLPRQNSRHKLLHIFSHIIKELDLGTLSFTR